MKKYLGINPRIASLPLKRLGVLFQPSLECNINLNSSSAESINLTAVVPIPSPISSDGFVHRRESAVSKYVHRNVAENDVLS